MSVSIAEAFSRRGHLRVSDVVARSSRKHSLVWHVGLHLDTRYGFSWDQRGHRYSASTWHVLRVHRYILRRGAKGVSTPPVHYASRRWSVSYLQARNGRRSPHGVGPGLEPHGRVQTLRWLHARPVRELGSTPPRRGKLVPTCHGRGPALHLRWRLAAYPVYSVGSARAHTVYGCMACSWLATVGRLAICK